MWASASGGCFPTAGPNYGQEQNRIARYNRMVLFKWAKVSPSLKILYCSLVAHDFAAATASDSCVA